MTMTTKRTEEILESLSGLQKAAAPNFFYTRLIGKMQHELPVKRKTFLLLRPAFITAVLSIVLVINVASLVLLNDKPKKEKATIESFAEAYNFNSPSLYE
jgi:hypothetical protein